jgi:hypothetical protein
MTASRNAHERLSAALANTTLKDHGEKYLGKSVSNLYISNYGQIEQRS